MRGITIDGRVLGSPGVPAICAPLVARTADALLAEARAVAARQPDLLEWRVDFFDGIADPAAVAALGPRIREAAGGLPLLFTRRSQREGGQPIALNEDGVVAMYRAVCDAGGVSLVDFEMDNDAGHVCEIRAMSRERGIGLVLSFHDFEKTPPVDALVDRFAQAHRLGADAAKLAVMPRREEDVLALLEATLRASRALPIPVIGMSMGGLGAASRLCGGAFGSALTFAVAGEASAPGQMPIEGVRAALETLWRAG
ncbi:type I 3-dehydroquinate dehydratase [Ramlibacter sp.]|uniref:type I 3-dehydroquinate dehydratase n=1 Tax=Ramlibacter sp. TaxID=1917967 RepID=UPI0017E3741E|nr:type I 3-dehydroquinate dehydratase [Ramlibacter sp.]MBA2672730.1 type I 3-dehydroquinate dehydratase [Ramlibacter sp.]